MGIYWKVIGIFKAAEHQPAVLYWTPWKISRMVERVNVFWMCKPCVIHECVLIQKWLYVYLQKSEMKQSSSDSQLIIKPEKVRHVNHKCHCSIHLPDWRTVKTLTYGPCIIRININGKATHFQFFLRHFYLKSRGKLLLKLWNIELSINFDYFLISKLYKAAQT